MSAHRHAVDGFKAENHIPDPADGEAIVHKYDSQYVGFEIGSGAETNTVADPARAGKTLVLHAHTDSGGSRAITFATAVNTSGHTIATFEDADDCLVLYSVKDGSGGFKYVVVENVGLTLS